MLPLSCFSGWCSWPLVEAPLPFSLSCIASVSSVLPGFASEPSRPSMPRLHRRCVVFHNTELWLAVVPTNFRVRRVAKTTVNAFKSARLILGGSHSDAQESKLLLHLTSLSQSKIVLPPDFRERVVKRKVSCTAQCRTDLPGNGWKRQHTQCS